MDYQLATLYVVLIEPSRSQSKLILQQFEKLGIQQYKHLSTGAEALATIFEDVPDLVISALHLEDMTGSDLVHRLRGQAETESTPFILISTARSFRELDPIKQAGASAVLPKPFSVKDLHRAILNTMEWEHPDQIELEDMDTENLEVLVVDDSGMARKMICRTLAKMGIEKITQAGDGAEAIPLIQSNLYDLIVTDFNMPEVDGHELLKFIRTESSQSSVPVLMVTTEGDASKLAGVQQDGVSAILDKPFGISEVKKVIENSLAFS